MRIACLTHYYIEDNRAGGELMIHALLKALADAGHQVTAYITDTAFADTVIDGVRGVYDVDVETILDSVDYDVVISQFQSAPHAMASAKRRGKPFVFVVHNDIWATLRVVRLLAARDLVLYNTEWIRALNTTQASEVVVHPPIDRKAFKTKTSGEYVSLVNLTIPKGVDIFFELARRMPDVKFLGVKGGYWKENQRSISLPNVTIIENTPNMRRDVYAKSKVVLMPSTYETFGMVAAEAITSGIPVIASPTAGLKENLGDAGIYVRRGSNDADKWEAELRALLTDAKYYARASRRALARSKVIDTATELKGFVRAVEGLIDGKA